MPSVSKKQHNLMAMVANDPKAAKRVGIKQSVGKEFMSADKGKKFGTGGDVNYTYGGKGQINKQRTRGGSIYGVQKNIPNINLNKEVGLKEGGNVATKKLFRGKETAAEELKEAKALKSGKISKSQYVAGEKAEGHGKGAAKTATAIKSGKISPKQYAQAETMMCGGGKVKKMADGGRAMPPTGGRAMGRPMPPMGGAPAGRPMPPMGGAPAGRPMPPQGGRPMPRQAAPAAPVMKKGGAVKKMASGGLAAGHKSADGIAKKGKTKARAVTMKKGGKC